MACSTSIKNISIYHGKCPDGFGAVLAARKSGLVGEYIAGFHHEEPPSLETVRDANVFFLDFCFPPAVLFKWLPEVRSITVIDHHETTEQTAKTLTQHNTFGKIHWNLAKGNRNSGCVMAWKFFHGISSKIPQLLLLIEDRDLWKWTMRSSKPFLMWLDTLPFDERLWIPLLTLNEEELQDRVAQGQSMLTKFTSLIEDAVSVSTALTLYGFPARMTFSLPTLNSDIGSLLAEKCQGIGMAISMIDAANVKVSLRSIQGPGGGIDVREIAQRWGGGGHRNAASCVMTFDRFQSIVLTCDPLSYVVCLRPLDRLSE